MITHQKAARRLLRLIRKDALVRNLLEKAGTLRGGYHPMMERVHLRNASELEKIIAMIGYPTIDKVGADASEAAWRIIQHAISRPAFQRDMLSLLKSLPAGAVSDANIAYLEDRICFYERKPQRYGTQFDYDDSGRLAPWTLLNAARVDEWREAAGLPRLEVAAIQVRKAASPLTPGELSRHRQAMSNWLREAGWIHPM